MQQYNSNWQQPIQTQQNYQPQVQQNYTQPVQTYPQLQQVQNNNLQFQNRPNHQVKQYDENVVKLIGFSFPFNHLLMVSLMKRIPNSTDYKELYFGFITCVTGVGQVNSRTYDFTQKIVQKFSLRDLNTLAFALKQLAINNTTVLPFTKFTNSGSGVKTLYLQYKENLENFNNSQNSNHQYQYQTQQSQNTRKMETNIVLGSSYGNIKINIPISKSDAYSIADIIEQIYKKGLELEMNDQIKMNISTQSNKLSTFSNTGVQVPPMSNPVTIG